VRFRCPDDGGSKHLWNVGKLLPDYTAQQPRRQAIFNAFLFVVKYNLRIGPLKDWKDGLVKKIPEFGFSQAKN
jgi:hypothetical protein